MTDLELYNKYKQPPQWVLKQITAGRLKGMTDIRPQWRIDALTELFGLCGFGWYPEIVRQWIETGSKGEMVANTQINLYVLKDGQWSKPISAIGGSMFVADEKNGLHTSDEAFKMSYTDALSVACKQLGIAGEIYRGNSGHSKYEQYTQTEYKTPSQKAQETRQANKESKEEYLKQYKAWMEWFDKHTGEITTKSAIAIDLTIKGLERFNLLEQGKALAFRLELAKNDGIPDDILNKNIKPEEYLQAG